MQAGQAVKAARKERGWTQSEVAAKAGVSVATVSRLEAGGLPRADRLARIAAALDLPFERLLAGVAS